MKDTTKFLQALYRTADRGYFVIWQKQGNQSYWFPVNGKMYEKVEQLVNSSYGVDIYFGIGLRAKPLTQYRRGTNADVIGLPALWLDLDVKSPHHKNQNLPETLDDAFEFLNTLPFKPTIVVKTGGGLQVYWLFNEIWYLEDVDAQKKAAALIRNFQEFVINKGRTKGWELDKTWDLSRVLRLPGTYNYKSAPAVKVEILEMKELRYNPEDFEGFLKSNSLVVSAPQTQKLTADFIAQLWQGVPEGRRHNTALQLAGHLLGKKLHPNEVLELLRLWNSRNTPPLPDGELHRIVIDLAEKDKHKQTDFLKFPESAYLGVAKDFVELFAEHYEAPEEFWYFALLTLVGNVIAGKITLEGDLPIEPRFYTILLGRSGVEKKSTVIRRTIQFLTEAGLPLHVVYGAGSGEGLAETLNEAKNVTLVADEFRALMVKANVEGSTIAPLLATLFESHTYENRTKGKKLQVKDGRLSLLAASTFDSYGLLWDSHSIAIGLPNRFLIVPAQSDKIVPFVEKIPIETEAKLKQKISNLYQRLEELQNKTIFVKAGNVLHQTDLQTPVELKLSDEARKIWKSWYLTRSQDIHSTRLDTLGLRLAVVLNFLQGNFEEVNEKTMQAVVDILNWQYMARVLYDPIDAVNTIAELEEKIRRVLRAHGGKLTFRDLQKKTHAERYGAWLFSTALQNLSKLGEARITREERKKIVELIV